MISFSTIPSNIKVPLFWAEVDNSAANTTQDGGGALLIGYCLPGAEIERNLVVPMPSADVARTTCGRGSQLARMVEAYRRVDPLGELYVIAVEESGTAATGTMFITGTATAAGTVSLYIGTRRVQAAVSAGDTATSVANTLIAAIADNEDLPVTGETLAVSSGTGGAVLLTAKNKGAGGSDVPLTLSYYGAIGGEELPAGLTVELVQMDGGAGEPDLNAVVSAMADEPFDFIGLPYNSTNALQTMALEMDDTSGRWSYIRQLYGHVYTAKKGSFTDLIAFGDSLNLQHISVAGYEVLTQTPTDELVAARTARNAVFIRNDPARPTQTGELNGALPAQVGRRFTITEQQMLLSHGIATSYFEGGALRIQREITTYQHNSYGTADNSYLDSETLHTLAYTLRRLKAAITSKYGRHKLANNGTRLGAGQAAVTPNVIKGEILAIYRQLELAGIVENFELFKQNLIVERNKTDPTRLDVLFPPDLVNQLRIFAVLAQFRLQYEEEAA